MSKLKLKEQIQEMEKAIKELLKLKEQIQEMEKAIKELQDIVLVLANQLAVMRERSHVN